MLGAARETWVYDWLWPNLSYHGDLTPYVMVDPAPQIQHDASQGVRRQFRFSTLGNPGVDPLNDLVRAHYRLLCPDGGWADWALGTFLFMPPTKSVSEAASTLQYTALDLGQLLVDDTFPVATSVNAGANYVTAVQTIASSVAAPTPIAVSIPDPGISLQQSLVWDAGTTKLAAINELLAAINYRSAWFNEWGLLRSDPIPDYNSVQASWRWNALGGNSVVTSTPFQEIPDWSNAFNFIKVIGEDPRQVTAGVPQPIYAEYENTHPETPIGRPRFRRKTKTIKDSKIASQAVANARARTEGQAASRIYANVTINTLAWPFSQDHDLYHLTYSNPDDGIQDWDYLEMGWTMACGVGHETQHLIQRVTTS